MEELGAVISGSGTVGGIPEGVGKLLEGGGSGGATLRGGDVGPCPEDGEGHGHISIQGHEEAHQESAAEEDGWGMGLPASVGGTGGSGDRGDKEVDNKEAEHSRAIYCDATDSGPM